MRCWRGRRSSQRGRRFARTRRRLPRRCGARARPGRDGRRLLRRRCASASRGRRRHVLQDDVRLAGCPENSFVPNQGALVRREQNAAPGEEREDGRRDEESVRAQPKRGSPRRREMLGHVSKATREHSPRQASVRGIVDGKKREPSSSDPQRASASLLPAAAQVSPEPGNSQTPTVEGGRRATPAFPLPRRAGPPEGAS